MPVIKTTMEIDLDIETAAKWFAELDDDQMCRFLVAVAKEADAYPGSPDNQWYYLGGHLKSCECSTEAAREMVLVSRGPLFASWLWLVACNPGTLTAV